MFPSRQPSDIQTSRRRLLLGSVVVAMLCAVLLLATSSGLPMVWDEGNAILRAEAIGRGDWQYTTQREGHPAFYGIVIALGQRIAAGELGYIRRGHEMGLGELDLEKIEQKMVEVA